MIQTFKMAWRDLGRNRRRSFFSALALGIGLSLLLLIASVLNGEMHGSMDTAINLQSGHLQVQAKTYNADKLSLDWQDLIESPASIAQQVASIQGVKAATPRLFVSGIVGAGEQSAGVRIFGVDATSAANAPFKDGMVAGTFINNDDHDGVLIGLELAKKLGLNAGDTFNLLVNTSNGDVDEQQFTIRGVYSTRTPPFDEATLLMPLAKAQAISGAGDRASVIFVLLNDRDQTDAVAAALQGGQYQVKTYSQLNDVLVQTEALSRGYMIFIYLIVLAITATVIVNTLIMAVFERTREIGILTAIGMKSRRVMAMFFTESALLAIAGILIGLILGGIMVWYFTTYGFFIGNMGVDGIMLGERIYARLTMSDAVTLSLLALVVTLLAALYPALLAARMEPVVALRGGE
jgi:ABC-type lipoprotein release transport system permease subunit